MAKGEGNISRASAEEREAEEDDRSDGEDDSAPVKKEQFVADDENVVTLFAETVDKPSFDVDFFRLTMHVSKIGCICSWFQTTGARSTLRRQVDLVNCPWSMELGVFSRLRGLNSRFWEVNSSPAIIYVFPERASGLGLGLEFG